ncbi:MAG: DUF1684 domain-containing protein [Sphingobacteriales bacterium]|nr:DUF1684 domain-containing protein [Sphingobacteriales bacterium]
MKFPATFILALLLPVILNAQPGKYTDSLQHFRDNYISTHEVVLEKDRARLRFYPINGEYRIAARVERIYEAPWFGMETSGRLKKNFRVYAILHFSFAGQSLKLSVYQSQQLMNTEGYTDYLFIPFTDQTNGEETYENGRYIDITTANLQQETFYIDFNKSYNPYCAYISNVYNCPIPPKENNLAVAIGAGEKKYGAPQQ